MQQERRRGGLGLSLVHIPDCLLYTPGSQQSSPPVRLPRRSLQGLALRLRTQEPCLILHPFPLARDVLGSPLTMSSKVTQVALKQTSLMGRECLIHLWALADLALNWHGVGTGNAHPY